MNMQRVKLFVLLCSALFSAVMLSSVRADDGQQGAPAKGKQNTAVVLSYEEIPGMPSVELRHSDIAMYSTTPSQSVVGRELVVNGNVLPALCVPRFLDTAELRVVLDLGEEYKLGGNLATTASLTVDIVGYTGLPGATGAVVMVTRCTLKAGGQTPEQLFRVNIKNSYTNVGHFAVFIAAYNGTTMASVQNALRLTLSCVVKWRTGGRNVLTDPWYPLNAPIRVQTVSPGGSTISTNPVTFVWDGITCEANFPMYQVQILRLYNTLASSTGETDVVAEVDWNKALMVETAATSLTLTLAEGQGYYMWRVRPVGNYYDGGITNPLNWGVWSTTPTVDVSDGMLHLTAPTQSAFFYQQFDDDKNWIFNRTFTEHTKISEGIIYANSLQMSEQTQKRMLSQNTKILQQTLYDYAGRAVVQSLPVPFSESAGSTTNALRYVGRASVMTYNGTRYGTTHFDNTGTVYQPNPVNGGVLASYYTASGSSPIPNAEGYPYTRTLYYNDGANRVKETSGAGAAHKVGAGHTVRTLYAAVSDQELVRIFGDEAPDATSVGKVIQYDPNTTGTVQYVSKEGKVIATALVAGSPNEPLETLGEEEIFAASGGDITDPIIDYTLGKTSNVKSGNSLRAGKNVTLTEPGTVTLSYELTPRSLQEDCMDICLHCDYLVYFAVFNTDNNSRVFFDSLIVNPAALMFNSSSCADDSKQTVSFPVFLEPGSYRIERRIVSNNAVPFAQSSEAISYLQWHKKTLDTELRSRFNALNSGNGLDYVLTTFLSDTSSRPLKEMYDYLYAHFGGLSMTIADCGTITFPERLCPPTKCEAGNFDFEQYAKEKLGTPSKVGDYFGSHKAYSGLDTLSWGMWNTVIQNMLADGYNCEELWSCWESAVETKVAMSEPEVADAYSSSGQSFNLLDAFLDCAGRKFVGVTSNRTVYLARPYKYFKNGGDGRYNDCNGYASSLPDSVRWGTLYKCWMGTSPPPDQPVDDVVAINILRDSCHNMCEYRRVGFREEIIRTYLELNPSIDTTTVPVDCILDSLMNNCHASCNQLAPGIPEWVYKKIARFTSYGFDMEATAVGMPACPASYELIGQRSITPAVLQVQINAINAVLLAYQTQIFDHGFSPQLRKELDSILMLMIYDLVKESPGCALPYAPTHYVYTQRILDEITTLWQQGMLQTSRVQLYLRGCTLELRTGTHVKGGCLFELGQDTVVYTPNPDIVITNNPCLKEVPPATSSIVLCENMCVWSTGCSICIHWIEPEEITTAIVGNKHVFTPKTCKEDFAPEIKASVQQQLQALIESKQRSIESKYNQTCAAAEQMREKFSVRYKMRLHHYTLYYYDRAGNLVRTVPPAGVKFVNSRSQQPAHTYVTKYKYNSLQQLVWQETPDGGAQEFIYNNKGQLRLSRNARQATNPLRYSYVKYDELGRAIETGETQANGHPTNLDDVGSGSFPTSSLSERIWTYYTTAAAGVTYLGDGSTLQTYLQNRVSYSISDMDGNIATTTDQVKTVYSYDPHGNVKWVQQAISGAAAKYIRYEYDLYSGSVVRLLYNENKEDRFFYRYEYDEDNRIKQAFSSRDGYIWEGDVRYSYYAHGPMSRTEIGEDRIQGMDYVYTIHGWLKAVNHPTLDPTKDPSADGGSGANATVARDVFGMMLGYYQGDFNKSSSPFHSTASDKLWDNSRPQGGSLYNGNIANCVTKIGSTAGSTQYANQQTGYVYRYDRLSRIKFAAFRYESSGWQTPAGQQYNTGYSYDPNGNLKTLYRYGHAGLMDQFTYAYYGESTSAPTNRLQRIADQAPSGGYADDIDNQTITDNYAYDGTGNLKGDESEHLTIEWTVLGKVKQVANTNGKVIKFLYDATGNRVRKEVTGSSTASENKTTYYMLDPQGKQLAVYGWKGQTTDSIEVEYTLHGSERVGQHREVFNANDRNVLTTSIAAREDLHNSGWRYTRIINRTVYELKDHLGNVRVVIGDVKELQTGGWYMADVKAYNNYYVFGMQQPERCWQSNEYRYGFNGQEKVDEIASGHYTAEFWEYDSRTGRRWNLDPKPVAWESGYAVNRNNPLYNSDPKGDNPIMGAIIGAFTEYAGIIGSKMLFEGMTFSEANSDLGWSDGLDITIAAGFGAATGAIDGGITRFASWISKPTNRKILVKLLEVGVSAIEGSLKQIYKDEDFDLLSVLAGALAEVGMGDLLKKTAFKEAAEQAGKNADVSAKRVEDLATRKKPNEKLIKKAEKKAESKASTAKALETLDNTMQATTGSVAKTTANGAQNAAKSETDEKK